MLEDKIELIVGNWQVQCVDVDFESFLRSLSSRSEMGDASFNFPACEFRNIGNSWSRKSVKILSPKLGRGLRSNAPLFSGKIQVNRVGNQNDFNGDSFRISLALSINPTRFCQYQHPIPNSLPRNLQRVVLFATQDKTHSGTGDDYEFSLDASDNVLLEPSAKTHAALWVTNLRRYIKSIENYFNDRLEQFRTITPGFTHRRPETSYSLRSIESYFEVKDESPIATVKQISQAFWALGNNTSESQYPVANNLSIDGYSTALRTNFRDGEAFKVYAKTNKRIRLEVSRRHYENPNLMPNRAYRVNSLVDLISLIRYSSQLARESALGFLEHLDRYILNPQHSPYNAWRFLSAVLRVIPDSSSAHLLLDMLIGGGGGIKSSMVPAELKSDLKSLVNAGVIEYRGRPILRYVIAPRYQSVIPALLGSGNG